MLSDQPRKMADDRIEKEKGIKGRITQNLDCSAGGSRNLEKLENSKVCRICHFGREVELIKLGCDCKGELGCSHQHCAEAWFGQKGDRICEICRKVAKNVKTNTEDRSVFMMEWNEMRMVAVSLDDDSHESSHHCKRIFCNLMLATLFLLFVLLWLFQTINLT